MSLNCAIVSREDPFNRELMEVDSGQPMELDSISAFSELPLDVVRIIFQNLKADLPNLALVCRNWKNITDDKEFREMIRPVQAFGTKEWQEYFGVDAGAEPPLPRCAYGDLEREDGLLTFIPDKVKVTKENGGVKEILLDNLEVIGNLVEYSSKKGNKTNFTQSSWDQPFVEHCLREKRQVEKPHWVWIKKEVIGRRETYPQQQECAKASGANISGLIDTAISVFMEYLRSGERSFVCDPPPYFNEYVRVNERTCLFRLSLGFTPDGLDISHHNDDFGLPFIAIAPARRSFGQC